MLSPEFTQNFETFFDEYEKINMERSKMLFDYTEKFKKSDVIIGTGKLLTCFINGLDTICHPEFTGRDDFIKAIKDYIRAWKTDVSSDFKDWPLKKNASECSNYINSEINRVDKLVSFLEYRIVPKVSPP